LPIPSEVITSGIDTAGTDGHEFENAKPLAEGMNPVLLSCATLPV
jgi:hypothetical protein